MIRLEDQERDALIRLSQNEKRDPRAQAALIIREYLERRGLLLVNATPTAGASAQQSGVMQNATS
jgi:hypothetical protein